MTMTPEELKLFKLGWLEEAVDQLSSSLDRECHLGGEWDLEIYDIYRNILLDLFSVGQLAADDYEALVKDVGLYRHDDSSGGREVIQ